MLSPSSSPPPSYVLATLSHFLVIFLIFILIQCIKYLHYCHKLNEFVIFVALSHWSKLCHCDGIHQISISSPDIQISYSNLSFNSIYHKCTTFRERRPQENTVYNGVKSSLKPFPLTMSGRALLLLKQHQNLCLNIY